MQRVIKLMLVWVACWGSTMALAQTADTVSLSLDQAQNYALENNVDLENSTLDKKITKMRNLEIVTEGLPQISSQVKYTDNFELPVSIIPAGAFGNPEDLAVEFGTQHNANVDLSITQLIADGRYFIGLKASKAFVALSQQQYEMTEIQVRQNIATAYYAALTAQKGRSLIEKNLTTVKQLLFETEKLYENGFVEELDVDRLTLSLNNLNSKYKEAVLQEQLTLNVLKYQIGMPLQTPIKLTEELESLLLVSIDSSEVNFDHTQRVEYQLLQTQYNIRKYDVQQTRAAYFPSLVGFFGYNFNAQRTEFNFFDTNEPWFRSGQVGLQLNIPIFDSYRAGTQVQQKKLDMFKIANNIENFESQAQLEVMTAKNDYENAILEYENQKESLALAQKIFNKVTVMKREGLASSLELAEAESSLNETQGNYVAAMYDLLVAKTKLDKALGKY